MSTDTVVRARIDSETKERATEVLQAMGLSVPMPFACCCCEWRMRSGCLLPSKCRMLPPSRR